MGDDGPNYIEDHNRGYFHPHGSPRSIGELQGQEARQRDDERWRNGGGQDSGEGLVLVVLLAFLGLVVALIVAAVVGLANDRNAQSTIISLAAILLAAAVLSVLTLPVVASARRQVAAGVSPRRLLLRCIAVNSVGALLFGAAFAWIRDSGVAVVPDLASGGVSLVTVMILLGLAAFAYAAVLKRELGFLRGLAAALPAQAILLTVTIAILSYLQARHGIRIFS